MTDKYEHATLCAAHHPETNEPILIRRGVQGYWPAPGLDVDRYNVRHGITVEQVEAMQIGSMFGWDVPGAKAALEIAPKRR